MPEVPAQSTDAEQQPSTDAGAPEPASARQDGVAQLAETLQALQTRYDDLLRRFLAVIEERRALDQALMLERVKAAGLERDLAVFQREWQTASADLTLAQSELTGARAQNDHHKQLALKLQRQLQEAQRQHDQEVKRFQQQLQEIRSSRTWQMSQKYWKLTRRVRGR